MCIVRDVISRGLCVQESFYLIACTYYILYICPVYVCLLTDVSAYFSSDGSLVSHLDRVSHHHVLAGSIVS